MAATMQEQSTGRLYDLWARIYDHTFGRLVHKRQVRAIAELRLQPGQTVLDLGIGTGMTLPLYPRDVTVVGFDLSRGMLDKAAAKCDEHGLDHVQLLQGDAMHPPIAEGAFDHVLITHVITVVSDAERLLEWATRLVKPGGRVVILNHFAADVGFFRVFERWLNPIFVKIGWRSDLDLGDLLDRCAVPMRYQFKLGVWDIWQVVVLQRPLGMQTD